MLHVHLKQVHLLRQLHLHNLTKQHVSSTYIPLLQVTPELPRLHHIKALRKDLNLSVETIPLSHPFEGCYVHLREALTQVLSPLVSNFA